MRTTCGADADDRGGFDVHVVTGVWDVGWCARVAVRGWVWMVSVRWPDTRCSDGGAETLAGHERV